MTATLTVPTPTEAPYCLDTLGAPALAFAAYGEPAPQGSKTPGRAKNGNLFVRESSAAVKPWRAAVTKAARTALPADWTPLGVTDRDAVVVDLVFTIARPAGRPKTLRVRPAVYPDLDKLVRSTLDACTTAGVFADDGRVVGFRRLDEFYLGDPDPDTLPAPGVLIRAWQLPVERL